MIARWEWCLTSWARDYRDLAELKREAMLAVAGTMEGVVRVVQDETKPWPARATSVHTEYMLHVDRVVWDPHEVAPGDRLLSRHPGGVPRGGSETLAR